MEIQADTRLLKLASRLLKALIFTVLVFVMTLALYSREVSAATLEYSYLYLTLDVRDDVIVTTQDTPKNSELWAQQGVVNPEDTLEDFKGMGVLASFYDPETRSTVNFIAKKSTDTVQQFTFKGMSDDEIRDYVARGIGDTEDAQVSISLFEEHGIKFFRVEILVTTDLSSALEVLFGTLINGQMLQFDIYKEGDAPVIDDSFARELVSGINFTSILTAEDYEQITKASMLKVALTILGVIAAFAVLVFVSKFTQKQASKKAKRISEYMQDFRARERAGEIDRTAPALFTVNSTYTDAMMDDFTMYTAWLKDIVRLVLLVIMFTGMSGYLLAHDSVLFGLIIAAAGIVFLYINYRRSEKQKGLLKDQYNTKAKPVATLRFYNEYFDVLGLGTKTEYIYKQITAVKTFKTCMYLYLGNEHAVIVDLIDVPEGTDRELYVHIKKAVSQDR